MKIKVRNNNINSALRMFKRKTKDTIVEVRERQEFVKPCLKKNREKAAAKLREKRRQKSENDKQF